MDQLQSFLQDTDLIIADGAMGTLLFDAGLPQGTAPHFWNLEHPDRVADVHRQYLEAGSQLLLTNTFSANRFRTAQQDADASIAKLNLAGARILRAEVEAAGGNALVAGDIGPSGRIMVPYGDLSPEDARAAFAEQAAALIEGGVDLIWIETMSDLEEAQAAFDGVRQISLDIPIIITMTFDTQGRTMMGVSPEQAASTLTSLGAAAVGGNCGKGPQEIVSAIEKMHASVPQAILVAKANAGIPKMVDGNPTYDAGPPVMAEYALKVRAVGARIIGACCGSTPAHIRAIAGALSSEKHL
jgi:5-methyltetrahydrofolate--homocysteine methyltransferase